jgi:hypothetical protein
VYDAVSGNRIEARFALPVCKQYDTVQPCADSWCLLKIPELPGAGHGALPAKQGWATATPSSFRWRRQNVAGRQGVALFTPYRPLPVFRENLVLKSGNDVSGR